MNSHHHHREEGSIKDGLLGITIAVIGMGIIMGAAYFMGLG